MIDYLSFTLPASFITLEFCEFQKETIKKDGTGYRVYSLAGSSGYPLSVVHSLNRDTVTVSGSIRKYYFGEKSINDLTRWHYETALQTIASTLSVTLNDMLAHSYVRQIELGVNLLPTANQTHDYITRPILPLTGSGLKYYHFDKYRNEREWTAFNKSKSKIVKVYDKAFCIGLRDRQVLRFEVVINKAIKQHLGIEYLSDTLTFWDWLNDYWHKLSKFAKFVEKKELDSMNTDKYILARVIEIDGLPSLEARLKRELDTGRISKRTLQRRLEALREAAQQASQAGSESIGLNGEFESLCEQAHASMKHESVLLCEAG